MYNYLNLLIAHEPFSFKYVQKHLICIMYLIELITSLASNQLQNISWNHFTLLYYIDFTEFKHLHTGSSGEIYRYLVNTIGKFGLTTICRKMRNFLQSVEISESLYGNVRIFLSHRFYVKLKLVDQKAQKLPFQNILGLWIYISMSFWSLWRMKMTKNNNSESLR